MTEENTPCFALGVPHTDKGSLAACGVTPSRRTAELPQQLTPQERTIATLVCQGLTNQEVAQQLVLSVKTVGYHLGNVYAKLGVHSRTRLAAAWTAGS